jgi:hypothetical protein
MKQFLMFRDEKSLTNLLWRYKFSAKFPKSNCFLVFKLPIKLFMKNLSS